MPPESFLSFWYIHNCSDHQGNQKNRSKSQVPPEVELSDQTESASGSAIYLAMFAKQDSSD